MFNILVEALIDSLKILAILFVFHLVLSFFGEKINLFLSNNNKKGPLIGASIATIPECGIPTIGAELYNKQKISIGTIVAIIISCNDEALPILLSNYEHLLDSLIIISIKLVYAIIIGYLVDFLFRKTNRATLSEDNIISPLVVEKETKFHNHFIHPLIHSLKIFIYILVINSLFAIFFFYFEDSFINFLAANKYLTNLYTLGIGLIPNCASSIIIVKLFLNGSINLGSIVTGLSVNAGISYLILFGQKKYFKKSLLVLGVVVVSSLILGYLISFIVGF
ncbi:MAG: arsenic efflux protein [Acholeplasmatales bacterium]|jgi:hypothetical protein|nr:arsenic efflux protein [Acholeplasmatales bacterium]